MVEPKQDDQYHFTGFFSMSLTHIPGILEGTCSMLIYVQDFPKNIQKLQQVSFCCYGSPEILKTWKKFSKVAKRYQKFPKVVRVQRHLQSRNPRVLLMGVGAKDAYASKKILLKT